MGLWMFLGAVVLIGLYFTGAEWKPLRYFCYVFRHRWYFVVSTPTLESGEIFCKRCGKIEFRKDGGYRGEG